MKISDAFDYQQDKKRAGPRLEVSALLLAGGRGVRMGGNKLFLSNDGGWLLERTLERLSLLFSEVLLCCGPGEQGTLAPLAPLLARFSVRAVMDAEEGRGPLEGLRQGLAAMQRPWGFLLGCDMPNVQEAVVRQLWALTPRSAQASVIRLDGYLMPLHAFYRADCLEFVTAALEKSRERRKGEAKLKSFYDDITLHTVEEEALSFLPGYRRSFEGCNTPEELRKALAGG